MSASLKVFYKHFSPIKMWDIRTENSSGTKILYQRKWKEKDYKVSWNQQRTKRQRRTEKLRSPDMAQLGFQYVLNKKKKKKRVHNSKHTLKVWGGSQHNAHIKKKRPHRSNGLTLGVFWGAKYKKIQWTGPIKRKAAIIKTHLNVTELSIKCISKNRKKAKKKKIIKGPIIPILNLEVMLLLGNSKIIHQISHIWSWGWINYNQSPG